MKFKNEPLTDFSRREAHDRMTEALGRVRREFGRHYPLFINGKKQSTRQTLPSLNPSNASQVVGISSVAAHSQADQALEAASRAFPMWSQNPVDRRAAFLQRMAIRLRARKAEFAAWMVYEVGKNWVEADADVAEAIDFLEYYAVLALRSPGKLIAARDERNDYRYLALGPVVVIPPWNFPLAILVGMSVAAIVAGNTVVLKPSSLSPVIAAKFVELAKECGLPAGVLNLLPGAGGAIGDYLVRDRRTRMVAFTGSKDVGLHINQLAAITAPGQPWIKRVIAEMGGKNAALVDETADLDAAARAIVTSAFGFQGQKCSACSRVFVNRRVYKPLLERMIDITDSLRLGSAEDPDNFMGPVVSADAKTRIEKAIAEGRRAGKRMTGGPVARASMGYFVQPTILTGLPKDHPLWFNEIFGPVVTVASVSSWDEALGRANETDYGLTGAVFSRRKTALQRARERFYCGNLYLNRKQTGALVGAHPFGGFNLSGTDSKAGGPDYLLLFQQAQAISERVQ